MNPTLNHDLVRVLNALCVSTDTPRSLTVFLMVKYEEWGQLIKLKTHPLNYNCAKRFREDNACTEILRKCRIPVPGVDRKQEALRLFWASEKSCYRSNERLAPFSRNGLHDPADEPIRRILLRAASWVKDVLGDLPRSLEGRFGPGSTFSDRGPWNTIPDKMSTELVLTNEATCLLPYVTDTAWFRYGVLKRAQQLHLRYIRGNRFITVPKDAGKDRGICIEPSVNVFLQKSVGGLIRSRLMTRGLNLRTAQEVHRQWACRASLDGEHATIDLSSASDTVSRELVRLLLPSDWYELMDSLRSPYTFIQSGSASVGLDKPFSPVKEGWVKLEKFSSMGNGYTFELETLIFAALAYAVGCGTLSLDFSVYGDDIIVPTTRAADVLAILKYCGFEPNVDKTFTQGNFRESCGGDFFRGVSVRGHNLEEVPERPEQWISLANGIRRLGRQDLDSDFRHSIYVTAWMRCLDALPSHIRRLRGPEELGDLVICDDVFQRRWRHSIGYVRVYRPVQNVLKWHHWRDDVVMAAALYGCRNPGKHAYGVTPRGPTGYKVGYVAYS